MAWWCMIIMIRMNQLWIMSIRHSKLDQFGCCKCDAKSRHLCNPSWTRPCAGTPDMSSASRAVKEQDGKTLLGWSSRNSRKHSNLMLLQVTSQSASIFPYFSMTFSIFFHHDVLVSDLQREPALAPRFGASLMPSEAMQVWSVEQKRKSARREWCFVLQMGYENPIEIP